MEDLPKEVTFIVKGQHLVFYLFAEWKGREWKVGYRRYYDYSDPQEKSVFFDTSLTKALAKLKKEV